jgi:hypothetical protein
VGRAFGIFLLVVGIGLAAYGLPTSDTGLAGASLGSAALRSEATLSGVNEARDARSVKMKVPKVGSSGATGGADAGYSSTSGQAPMEKLRAAGQAARSIAAGQEAVGSHQTLSQTSKLDLPPAPKPVELAPVTRSAPPTPSVVANARRETAQVGGASDAKTSASTGATAQGSGWKTVVSQTTQPAVSSQDGNGTKVNIPPAPTMPATLSISSGAPAVTSGSRVQNAEIPAGSNNKPDTRQAEAKLDRPFADKSEKVEKPTPKPEPRAQVAQRYTAPVYLGRSPNSGSSSGSSSSGSSAPSRSNNNSEPAKRAFKPQDMWENSRRSGM